MAGAAVLVPVKGFGRAKLRLAPVLDPAARAQLARRMAERVVRSAAGLPVWVVCDDPEVADWAAGLGAAVVWEPGRGLNGAVDAGVRHLGAAGHRLVVVAAGDLPLADDLGWVADFDGVTLVPDRRRDGTNVIGVPPLAGFAFAYGPGSYARHLSEARRLGLAVRVVSAPRLAWDVDLPEDLEVVTA
ncbi:MAG TPA: 2-phospho-L-lactate guanylyltransferase [Acidimicrobiales bacterium]|nr:2-phospho-L-lactate guanylyltransferase [Acidimicrobiales bacterium]